MPILQRCSTAFLLAMTVTATVACAPIVETRGFLVDDDRVAEIAPGQSTARHVLGVLGTPTSVAPFDDRTWFYIGQRTERLAFFAPEVTERRVLVLRFDETGLLDHMDELSADEGQYVELVERETPTLGRRITFLEQIIGNLGRFEGEN